MPDIWTLLAFQLVAVLSGTVTAGIALAIGGVGGLLALTRRLKIAEDRIEDVDGKISRETKRRAADAATASRDEKKSIGRQAADVIAEARAQTANTGRPKVAPMR